MIHHRINHTSVDQRKNTLHHHWAPMIIIYFLIVCCCCCCFLWIAHLHLPLLLPLLVWWQRMRSSRWSFSCFGFGVHCMPIVLQYKLYPTDWLDWLSVICYIFRQIVHKLYWEDVRCMEENFAITSSILISWIHYIRRLDSMLLPSFGTTYVGLLWTDSLWFSGNFNFDVVRVTTKDEKRNFSVRRWGRNQNLHPTGRQRSRRWTN